MVAEKVGSTAAGVMLAVALGLWWNGCNTVQPGVPENYDDCNPTSYDYPDCMTEQEQQP